MSMAIFNSYVSLPEGRVGQLYPVIELMFPAPLLEILLEILRFLWAQLNVFFAKAMDGQHVAQCFQAGAFLVLV